ncbi:sorbitol dehydrogenase-like [Mya arenaria]|uniref:sorbitol dehydrogenase-like n=1 Tax=Mya arenaria TaxID=6604 RepID=UPI0022DFFE6E|nr:sorbitol dehydrogenase-like [Mya arenaria]
MSDTNLSAVLFKAKDLQLVERPICEPGKGEVQLCMQKVGICGSDVHYWQEGRIGDRFVVQAPMLLGHECSATVTKVGDGVTHPKSVGDRVAIEPHGVCRKCDACKTGRYNLCPDVFFLATPPDSGALARYHVHGADFVFKLPDNVSFEEGALIEPLSVGLHACRRARLSMGHRVLVCGAGPIGLCAMLSAKAFGAAAVCVTDIDSGRLEFAKKLGASHTLLIEKGQTEEQVAAKVAETLGAAPDRTIECSGAQFSVNLGVYATKPGGVFVIVGHGPSKVEFPVVSLVAKEIAILGSFRYINTWQTAIDMISCGKINVAPLVTHRFTLEDTLAAFETARSGVGVKVMIDCAKHEKK